MDRLARNAMLARQAGMTYGKWKAMQPVVPIEKKDVIPDKWVRCAECGKAFPPKSNKRFCDLDCRRTAYERNRYVKQKNADYMRQYRERRAGQKKMGGGNNV